VGMAVSYGSDNESMNSQSALKTHDVAL